MPPNGGVCAVYFMAHYTLLWLRLFFLFSNTNFQNTNKIMIKANELRIGNYLFMPFTSENVKVTGLALKEEKTQVMYIQSNFGISQYFALPEQYSPIELTEEWLLKAGFTAFKTNPYWYRIGFNGKTLNVSINGAVEIENFNRDFIQFSDICDHVHQLQNLYFALTGSELVFSTEP